MAFSKLPSCKGNTQKKVVSNVPIPSLLYPDIIGSVVFNFKLPNGLALRSAAVENGRPELRFEQSPRVPTLLEEDVAVVFKLALENARPEFFYISFPPNHPFFLSRWFKHYSPSWIRGTSVGELLADIDWKMKCLHIGTRTNEEKTVFKSWSATSNLKGLATRLDFPEDGDGSNPTIKFHCEHARVQKSENEILFPEEPKMKIVDGMSSQYSSYISEHLPSVAYHDEPVFLKMQELIKLILAVEWFLKEKHIGVAQEWILKHTRKHCCDAEAYDEVTDLDEESIDEEIVEPPEEMIPPKMSDFKLPCDDISISTKESKLYETLQKDHGVQLRYGHIDFITAEAKIFAEDGSEIISQKCLKIGIEQCNEPSGLKTWLFLPLPNKISTQQIKEEMSVSRITHPLQLKQNQKLDLLRASTCLKFLMDSQILKINYETAMKELIDIVLTDVLVHEVRNYVLESRQNKSLFTDDTATPLQIYNDNSFEIPPTSLNLTPVKVHYSLTTTNATRDGELNIKIRLTYYAHFLSSKTIESIQDIRITENNLSFVFASKNPNAPLFAKDRGKYLVIVPDADSWEDLLWNRTAPVPLVWQDPYIKISKPATCGGVCTKNFPVISETLKTERELALRSSQHSYLFDAAVLLTSAISAVVPFALSKYWLPPMEEPKTEPEPEWFKNYQKSENTLKVRARKDIKDKIKTKKRSKMSVQRAALVKTEGEEYDEIIQTFTSRWTIGEPPKFIHAIFSIHNTYLQDRWEEFKQDLCLRKHPQYSEKHYYGSALVCDIAKTQEICRNLDCGTCGITCSGMNPINFRKKKIDSGFRLAPNPSLCTNSQPNELCHKAMLMCNILPGKKHYLKAEDETAFIQPREYDSIIQDHGDIQDSEIIVNNSKAILPMYIIVYH